MLNMGSLKREKFAIKMMMLGNKNMRNSNKDNLYYNLINITVEK